MDIRRDSQTQMEKEVSQGLYITEKDWLELRGKCAWISYAKCTNLSRCANHGGREHAQMLRRTVSSHLKENMDAPNQSHIISGKGRLSTLPSSPWHPVAGSPPGSSSALVVVTNQSRPMTYGSDYSAGVHFQTGDSLSKLRYTISTLYGSWSTQAGYIQQQHASAER